jgi:type VI secretion system secreted protein Hcp
MAIDSFLKLDGIMGESEDANHKNEIRIHSYSMGGSQTTSVGGTGGSGVGRVELHDFTIMKHVDKATTPIFKALVSGTHIKTGTFTQNKAGAGGKPFLKVDFQELFVTSQQFSGSDDHPMESVTFSFNQIAMEYSQQNEQGIVTSTGKVTWNGKQGKLS